MIEEALAASRIFHFLLALYLTFLINQLPMYTIYIIDYATDKYLY